MRPDKRHSRISTPQVDLFSTPGAECQTRGEVYAAAVENYGRHFQNHGPRKVVASMTGIGYKRMCAAIEDERHLWDYEVDALFRVCLFPVGYTMLQSINFRDRSVQAPILGRVRA